MKNSPGWKPNLHIISYFGTKHVLQNLATPGFCLILLHKNKPLTSLRCRSLLFLLLRVSVRCAHRLEIAFGSLRRLRFRGLPPGVTPLRSARRVLELFHKNKPLTTLRCRSLLFLLLQDYGCFAPFALHNSARLLGFEATPFALRNSALPYVKSLS